MAYLDETGLAAMWQDVKAVAGKLTGESDGTVRGGIAELTAKGHAEQDGTPTPDSPVPIEVVRGRNLLLPVTQRTAAGITVTPRPDGSYVVNGTATQNAIINNEFAEPLPAGTYTLSAGNAMAAGTSNDTYIRVSISSSGVSQSQVALNVADNATTFTVSNPLYMWVIRVASGDTLDNLVIYPQLERGSTPQPYVPYGHVGMEVQGKNLLDGHILLGAADWHQADDGSYYGPLRNVHGYTKDTNVFGIDFEPNTQYTMSVRTRTTQVGRRPYYSFLYADGTNSPSVTVPDDIGTGWADLTLTSAAGKSVSRLRISYNDNAIVYIDKMQVERGSAATPYEPYHHTTTPIPLPQRGWVAGLPDGTADTLTLDGAWKVEWEMGTAETELASGFILTSQSSTFYQNMSSAKPTSRDAVMVDKYKAVDVAWQSLGNNQCSFINGITKANLMALCIKDTRFDTASDFNAWLAENPVTVLYPLATPVTEDCGYVEDWPTDIPEGAVIDIPELSEVGIKFFIDSSVTELAKQWYARANSEYADRITALEEAVADLVTGA